MKHDVLLDVCGEHCPKPVLEARKKLKTMLDDQVLKVVATDPLAQVDFEIFCKTKGYDLVGVFENSLGFTFFIQK